MSTETASLTDEHLSTLRRGYDDSYGDWIEAAGDVRETADDLGFDDHGIIHSPEIQHGIWRYQRDQHDAEFVRSRIEVAVGQRRETDHTVASVEKMLAAVAEAWDSARGFPDLSDL